MKLISVVGARPNFMKIAPFMLAIDKHNRGKGEPITHILVHTGQHYDDRMSEAFFQDLGIREPDINLGVGSGSHAEQVGNTMIEFEKVLRQEKPDWVIVVGDVNATLACSVTAKKEHVRVCHIEAGLRSGDRTMPEEINRLVTDSVSDLLFTPDKLAGENLIREGIPEEKIRFVGNIMIDTLDLQIEKAKKLSINRIIEDSLIPKDSPDPPVILRDDNYAVITLHRPSNVDHQEIFCSIIDFLVSEVSNDLPLIWPIHPRALKQMDTFSVLDKVQRCRNIILLHPIGYLEMLRLNMGARIMLTDSGGLQEECTVLGTPCLTLRRNTERPLTLREHGGASILVGNEIEKIRKAYREMLTVKRSPWRPELWDGKTAGRIVEILSNNL